MIAKAVGVLIPVFALAVFFWAMLLFAGRGDVLGAAFFAVAFALALLMLGVAASPHHHPEKAGD